MYYIYIIYSPASDIFYIGYSSNPSSRLVEHNIDTRNTFTSKHRPWILKAVFECSKSKTEAMWLEKYIKKQKSRKLIEQLCDPSFKLFGALAQLVRVPDVRD
jgi:putative endonuclease